MYLIVENVAESLRGLWFIESRKIELTWGIRYVVMWVCGNSQVEDLSRSGRLAIYLFVTANIEEDIEKVNEIALQNHYIKLRQLVCVWT